MRRIARSERVKLPGVKRQWKGGRLYKYHRRTGAKLPTDCPEDHPRFIAAWTAAEAQATPSVRDAAPGTIAAAVTAYRRSDRHAGLSEAYRRALRLHFDAIHETWGDAKLIDLRPRHIAADIGPLPTEPARKRMKAWRAICEWAVRSGLLTTNPSDGVQRPKAAKTPGHEAWTREDIEKVRAHWPVGHPRRLAVELLFWTGARISDAVRLGPGMIRHDGLLTFTQSKTGGVAYVPMRCALPPFCDPRDHALLMACIEAAPPGMVWLLTAHGKPRSVKALGNWVAETARLAKVEKTAHGLRKARLIDMAERGASALALQAWGGHKTLAEVQHYITAAERRRALIGATEAKNG